MSTPEPHRRLIVYYQDRSVQVTSAAIEIEGRVYPLDQLGRVWYQRDRPSWRELASRGLWSLTYLVPTVIGLGGLVLAFVLDLSLGARITVIVASLLVLVGLSVGPLIDPVLGKLDESFDRGLHRHEIWAEHNGLRVRLLETQDAARFGKIYRALQRAADA